MISNEIVKLSTNRKGHHLVSYNNTLIAIYSYVVRPILIVTNREYQQKMLSTSFL